MAQWRLEDDCFAPRRQLRVEYVGPNPFRVVSGMKGMLRKIMEVETKDVWERDFRWDVTDDPRMFYTRYNVDKSRDANTSIFIEVTMQGLQPVDPNKDGRLIILIGGKVRTRFDLDSPLKRLPLYSGSTKLGGFAEVGGWLWLYHRLFYNDFRRQQIEWCQEKLEIIWREMRAILKIPVPEMTV